MPNPHDGDQLTRLFDFIDNAPADEALIKMDCNDCCEKITQLAEQVAQWRRPERNLARDAKVHELLGRCREEFEALVAVIQRERAHENFDFADLA